MAVTKNLRNAIRAKLKEKSTWAGIGVVLLALGVPVPPGLLEQISIIAIGAIGVYEVVRKEG